MFTKEFLLSYYQLFKSSIDASNALKSLNELGLLDDNLKEVLERKVSNLKEVKAKIKEYFSSFIPEKVKLELGEIEIGIETPVKYGDSIIFSPEVRVATRTECVRLIFDEKFMRFYLKHEHNQSEHRDFLRKNFKLLLRDSDHLAVKYKLEE